MLHHISIFGYQASTYGLLTLLGIFFAIFTVIIRSKITGIHRDDIFYVFLLGIIGVLAGGKLLYLFTMLPFIWHHRQYIIENPAVLAVFYNGGFVFYGGLIGAVAVLFIYCRRYKINAINMLDTVIPGVPLAHAFGRLGCLSAGCCYGHEYHGLFAITFPEGSAAPPGIPLFPVQPLEAVLNFGLFIILMLIGRKNRKPGLLSGIYFVSYALIRFVLEFFRGDADRGVFLNISLSQWISTGIIPIALYFLFFRREAKYN